MVQIPVPTPRPNAAGSTSFHDKHLSALSCRSVSCTHLLAAQDARLSSGMTRVQIPLGAPGLRMLPPRMRPRKYRGGGYEFEIPSLPRELRRSGQGPLSQGGGPLLAPIDHWLSHRPLKPGNGDRYPMGAPGSQCPHLLDGPGCDPLKVATRVRIPLGTPGRMPDGTTSSHVTSRHSLVDLPTCLGSYHGEALV